MSRRSSLRPNVRPDPPVGARPFLTLLVASGGFVIVLDSFAAAVAFPRLVESFADTPRSTLAWVSSGYSIALAALLLVAGALADRYGGRRVYLAGMAAFSVGALASAIAPGPAC
ncbi:MAG: MFS transporter [Acidimicrobiales bacterium]